MPELELDAPEDPALEPALDPAAPEEPAPAEVLSRQSAGIADLLGYLVSSHLASLFVVGAPLELAATLALGAALVEADPAGVFAGGEAAAPSVVALEGACGEGALPGAFVDLGCVMVCESVAFFSLARSPMAKATLKRAQGLRYLQ